MTDELPELVLRGGPFREQMLNQLRGFIQTGKLHPGEQLPTVRAMAVELAIQPALVSSVYRLLELEGLITTNEGCGYFVGGPSIDSKTT